MGNSCCQFQHSNSNRRRHHHHQSKSSCFTSCNSAPGSVQRQPGRNIIASVHGSRNLRLSSDRDARNAQRVHDEPVTGPEKIETVQTQEVQFETVSASGSANQADEPCHTVRSDEEKMPPSGSNLEPDASEDTLKSDKVEKPPSGSDLEPDASEDTLKNDKGKSTPLCSDEQSACNDSQRSNSLLQARTEDEEDFCPTCLDGYDDDNPKILTKCKHHYHLGCILEWMERRNTCPMCDQVMVFAER